MVSLALRKLNGTKTQWTASVLVVTAFAICVAYLFPRHTSNTTVTILLSTLCLLLALPFLERGTYSAFQPMTFVILLFGGYVAGALYGLLISLGVFQGTPLSPESYNLLDLGDPETSRLMIVCLLYIILGFLAFRIGYSTRRVGQFIASRISAPADRPLDSRFGWVIGVYSCVGLIAYFYRMAAYGGVSSALTNLYTYSSRETSGYVLWLVMLFPIASVLWFYSRIGKRHPLSLWLHILVSFFILGSLGFRTRLVELLALLLIGRWYIGQKRIRLASLLAVAVLLWFVVFGILAYRIATLSAATGHQEIEVALAENLQSNNIFEYMLGSRDFTDLSMLVQIVRATPRTLRYEYGASFLTPFLLWIPREAWPNKPYPIDTELGLFFENDLTGLPPSFLAELYLNFQVPGILLGMWSLGLVCSGWFVYLTNNSHNRWAILFYALFVVTFLASLIRIDSGIAVTNFFVFSLPVYAAVRFMTRDYRRLRPSVAPIAQIR